MNTLGSNSNSSKGNYGVLGKEFEELTSSNQSPEQININPSASKPKVKIPEEADRVEDMSGNSNLDVILDIPVTVSMEVGNAEMSIRDLLKLNQGSVVELDRLAGDALDVLVNGTLIAHGEVVVVDDKFGIRLTDIVSPSERISRLR